MLICNNCFTVNENNVTRCIHCRMQGNFTVRNGESKSDEVAVIESRIICLNCGSDTPGEDTKCMHCHFPLPVPRPELKTENGQAKVQLFHFQSKSS